MVLEWTPEEVSLLQDRPFSAAASCSLHFKRSMGDSEPDLFQHQSTGYLRTTGQETLVLVSFTLIYSCMCIIIPLYETLHDRPFSVTCEESLRDSEHSCQPPKTKSRDTSVKKVGFVGQK